jgi:PAS domain S-box-containing protein
VKNKKPSPETVDLRQLAEERLRAIAESKARAGMERDVLPLLHELEVHQVELEVQNEELRRTRAEVEASLERLTDLYDFAPVGYCTLAKGGAIREVNLAGARLLGFERAGLVGKDFGRFVSRDTRVAFNAFLAEVFETRERKACDVVVLREGPSPLHVHIEGAVSADGGECRAALIDITDRLLADERLKQADQEREKAKRAQSLMRLFQGLAHEIRNPLFAINVNAAVLEKKGEATPDMVEYIGYVKEHVSRLDSLIKDLLELGRLPSADEMMECRLGQVAKAAAGDIESKILEASGRIHVEASEADLTIWAVPDRLYRVLDHLIMNALQHSPQKCPVLVRVGRSGDTASIEIIDQGTGITESIRESLFEPFVTTGTGHRGLGLALASHFITSIGGTIEANNNDPPPGAILTVRLPAAPKETGGGM